MHVYTFEEGSPYEGPYETEIWADEQSAMARLRERVAEWDKDTKTPCSADPVYPYKVKDGMKLCRYESASGGYYFQVDKKEVRNAPAKIAAEDLTFVCEHSPNCPSPYLVRLCGRGQGVIDKKPISETKDAFGYGDTFEKAFLEAVEKRRVPI
jgi:hypothetical protein